MNIVTKIYKGYTIKTENGDFEVTGSMKFRTGYKYICKTSDGKKVSLDREDVLKAQRDGSATVVYEGK